MGVTSRHREILDWENVNSINRSENRGVYAYITIQNK